MAEIDQASAAEGTAEKRVFIRTFGCQMNEYDTGKMRAKLAKDGFVSTEQPENADLILLNTCSVRDKAVVKMHSALGEYRKLKKNGRKVKIGVTGCVAQMEGDALMKKYRDLDLVFGPDGVPHVNELVSKAMDGVRVQDTTFLDLETYPFVQEVDMDTPVGVGSFVTIQKGCDNKCTFCIVPTTRGAEASRPSDQIIDEVRQLTARGFKEITLIGQNVNSYGLKVANECTFAQLLYKVAAVSGVERIRYTTSHPRDMGDDVIQAYRDLPQLTSHLHLPVQSGSSRILRRMKRFYSRERYLEVVAKLRDARPDIALSTDIIVGFPGETDADFEETMTLLDEVRFVSSFSFKYSPRPGTPSLKLRDDVPPEVASARLTRYQARQRELGIEYHRKLEGTVLDVLVEGHSKQDARVICGRSSSFVMVNFPGELGQIGRKVSVRVTRGFTHSCRGEAVEV
jgi:tRNA-2-methylthio-N6-dimethylallyladenosine synthase